MTRKVHAPQPRVYAPSPNPRRNRVPNMLPANAATSQTQPCRLPEAMPLKYAPMLQPYASRAPYPSSRPPTTAAAADRAETRHAGAKRPARPAAAIAPSTRPMSITDVTSSAIGAWSAARCAGVDQYGHASTFTFSVASALAPHNANADVTPHGRPAIRSVAMLTAARPIAPAASGHGPRSQRAPSSRGSGAAAAIGARRRSTTIVIAAIAAKSARLAAS